MVVFGLVNVSICVVDNLKEYVVYIFVDVFFKKKNIKKKYYKVLSRVWDFVYKSINKMWCYILGKGNWKICKNF